MSGLAEFAAEQQQRFDVATSVAERREQGHVGTPPAIASFMASMFTNIPPGEVRVLDAGAGVGTLSAAICQRATAEEVPRRWIFDLWENDPKLRPHLWSTMERCGEALRSVGHSLEFNIHDDDFILANTQRSLFDGGPQAAFHLAIMNPPYFKVRKNSPHARAMPHVVHGQPNAYALFMAIAADLVVPQGQLVVISPRSYFNGPYFQRFRRWFFDRMTPRQIHLFESRKEAFRDNEVLQEVVILHARRDGRRDDIAITSSRGTSFRNLTRAMLPFDKVIDDSGGERIIRVPANSTDDELVVAMDALPGRFRDSGFAVSTGPVVTFRATELLRVEQADDTAPLLWMHNVRPFVTELGPKSGKPAHLEVSDESRRLLLPAKRYVLLKRFTAKEERRRLVAGIFERSDSYSPWVGIENHVNYVYRLAGELTRSEAFGLAAYFNSTVVDRYFRSISGNTQVNASEIRALPLPDVPTICSIGEEVEQAWNDDRDAVDEIVGKALELPKNLVAQLAVSAE